MSLYKLGLGAPSSWFPGSLEPVRNQAGEIVAGLRLVRDSAPRMYEVGASEKQEPVDLTISGVLGWADDLAKTLFLGLGIFVTVSALKRKV